MFGSIKGDDAKTLEMIKENNLKKYGSKQIDLVKENNDRLLKEGIDVTDIFTDK